MIANYASYNFLIALKRTAAYLNEKPGHQSIFLIYIRFSRKVPGTGPAAAVKFPGLWKG